MQKIIKDQTLFVFREVDRTEAMFGVRIRKKIIITIGLNVILTKHLQTVMHLKEEKRQK